MSTPKPDLLARASLATPRRKPGRPFKSAPAAPPPATPALAEPSPNEPEALASAGSPPAVPYRSFKIALSVFKAQDALPARLDRGAWSNKLYNTNVREITEAFRFLGLIDSEASPTPEFTALLAAYGEKHWPSALRSVLERSYRHLLANNIAGLTASGLLRAFRTVYGTQPETTRRRCNFFMHAAGEAALDTGPAPLAKPRTRRRNDQRARHAADTVSANGARSADVDSPDAVVRDLLLKLPAYDAAWPDDVKRMWFNAYHELVQRLMA